MSDLDVIIGESIQVAAKNANETGQEMGFCLTQETIENAIRSMARLEDGRVANVRLSGGNWLVSVEPMTL